MAAPKFEQQVRRSTEKLVADLRVLIRQAAQESVRQALTAGSSGATVRRHAPTPNAFLDNSAGEGTARRDSTVPPGSRRPTIPPKSMAAPATRGKRSRREVEALTDRLLEYIEHYPGQRMEEISAGLGVPSSELTLPMRTLVRENHLRTLGEKRATIYFAR